VARPNYLFSRFAVDSVNGASEGDSGPSPLLLRYLQEKRRGYLARNLQGEKT
jgi:hypothetical protein